jgi:translocation and assembly module TamB
MTWKRKFAWAGLSLLALTVVLMIAGYCVFGSEAFHHYALRKIQQQASEALGANVQIQSFSLRVATLTADAYGVIIHGSEPASAPPLAQADDLHVGVKIVSLLHRKIDLSEIVLRHPVVHFLVRKDGSTNLPAPPQSNSNSSTNPFDLGIQHVLLSNGEVYYNDVKTPLEAELHDLQLEIKSQFASKNYEGAFSYRDGRIQYGTARPLPHDLNARFIANPSVFRLDPLVLTVASSRIELAADVQNYSQPSVQGQYKVTLHPQDFRAALQDQTLPSGEITLTGSLHYQYAANAPLLRAVAMDGELNSRELLVNSPAVRTSIRKVHGRFTLKGGSFEARELAANVLDGHMTAAGTIRDLDSTPVANFHAAMQAISLAAAREATRTVNMQQLPVTGRLSGVADASWKGSIENIKAHADMGLQGAIASASAVPASVPLNGSFHAAYDGRSQS